MVNSPPKSGEPQRYSGDRIVFSVIGQPDDAFLSQIAMFSLALRRAPGSTSKARLIAMLGSPDDQPAIPERWQPALENVEIQFVPSENFRQFGYHAQARARIFLDDVDCDFVIIVDADTMLLGDIDEVLDLLNAGIPAAGVIAHLPPPVEHEWDAIATAINGTPVALRHPYTLVEPDDLFSRPVSLAPYYFNMGFVAFRADALKEFRGPFLAISDELKPYLGKHPDFVSQMAAALAFQRLGWHPTVLPLKFNFPNDPRALHLHAYEALDIRLLHYLRQYKYRRDQLFAVREHFEAFISLMPEDHDRLVYDAIMRLTDGQYPFPA